MLKAIKIAKLMVASQTLGTDAFKWAADFRP